MPKIIAVFCDGTWNNESIDIPTHVRKCAQACAQTDTQVAAYFSGVGARTRSTWAGTQFWKYGGGIFGWGLNQRIREAYAFVVENYEPGDRLMVFGFSRGAYTARSLVGMIRKCGIMERSKLAPYALQDAFRLYRTPGAENHPDAPYIMEKRRKISPRFATSEADLAARDGDAQLVSISYLGVWDTVGALGIPVSVFGALAHIVNWRHRFHDTELSSLVKAARHAVAIDEKRKLFEPALWSNLGPHKKSDGSESLGLNQGTTGDQRPYQQLWFIGNHGTVGGTSKMSGLAAISRDWILEGALDRGLELSHDAAFTLPNAAEPGNPGSAAALYDMVPSMLAWRKGPNEDADLHPSVDERLDGVPAYRPQSLRGVRPYKISPV
ncbi:MAG: DUF2235 domain-containing protein [Pseudomonadota bacterium]